MKYRMSLWKGLVCLLAFSLVGCLQDTVFTSPFRPSQKSFKLKPMSPMPSDFDEYAFAPNGKRDPFLPRGQRRVEVRGDKAKAKPLIVPRRKIPRGPLQRFGLDAYRLKAVISGTARPMAVVIDPQGDSHIVRRGMAIGRDGRVVRIMAKGLLISTIKRTGRLTRRRTYRLMRFRKRGTKRKRGFVELNGRRLQVGSERK